MNKTLITVLFILAVAAFVGLNIWKSQAEEKPAKTFPVTKTEAEWKQQLSKQAYQVLRKHATEHPNTSPLNDVKKPGEFRCVGCDNLLFKVAHKFDSGTGWPSFYKPATDQSVGSTTDYKLVYPRTEIHCSQCGGHLGHVFGDGPRPTGKRYCINGVCLKFIPQE